MRSTLRSLRRRPAFELAAVHFGANSVASALNLPLEPRASRRPSRTVTFVWVIATDAVCEGLNLQTLGMLINVDLPWNPSRLEQRLGRIKRFGQARRTVDMLNLVYHDTQDEQIYQVIFGRLRDKFDNIWWPARHD